MRPSTSQPVVALVPEGVTEAGGEVDELVELRSRLDACRAQDPGGDESLAVWVVSTRNPGTHPDQSGDGHPTVEDLDLSPAADLAHVLREVGLQLADRRSTHQTIMVMII